MFYQGIGIEIDFIGQLEQEFAPRFLLFIFRNLVQQARRNRVQLHKADVALCVSVDSQIVCLFTRLRRLKRL